MKGMIVGTSEMASRIREKDWAATALGPMEGWSETLVSSVNLMLAVPTPVQVFWGPELITLYNDALIPFVQGRHPECLGRPARVVWDDAWPLVGADLEAVVGEGRSCQHRDLHLPLLQHGRLTEMFWSFSYSPIFARDGSVAGVLNLAQNTTESVRGAEEARASKEELQLAVDCAQLGRWTYEPATGQLLTDERTRQIYGVTRGQAAGSGLEQAGEDGESRTETLARWLEVVHPEDISRVREHFGKALHGGETYGLEHRIIRRGELRWLRSEGRLLGATKGRQLLFAIVEDITDRKLAEEDLRLSRLVLEEGKAQLAAIIDSVPVGIVVADAAGRISMANPAAERILGYGQGHGPRSAAAFAEHRAWGVLHPNGERLQEEEFPLLRAIRTGKAVPREEYLCRRGDGSRHWITLRAAPIRNSTGELLGGVAVTSDIDAAKRQQDALRRSEERFRQLVDSASVGIAIGNTAGDLTYLNPTLLSWLGYTAEEAQKGEIRWDRLTPPEYAEADARAVLQLNERGVAEPYEKAYQAKDGQVVPLLVGASVIPTDAEYGRGSDIAVFATNLSMQKRAEALLVQQEKLAAVGKLASSISHEINNPLEAVTNLLYIVRRDEALSQSSQEFLDLAERELARMSQVTSQTLRFHRQSTAAMTVRPEALIDEVLQLYGTRLSSFSVALHTEYATSTTMTCYEGDIRQVLNNLVGNAIDAMRSAGGELRIRTRQATRWKDGEAGVRVTIADTGGGMPEEVQQRIFEAFYTTKGANGTGLGLWISSRIVHKHRGTLAVRSTAGAEQHGTVFQLWLPARLATTAREAWHEEDGVPV